MVRCLIIYQDHITLISTPISDNLTTTAQHLARVASPLSMLLITLYFFVLSPNNPANSSPSSLPSRTNGSPQHSNLPCRLYHCFDQRPDRRPPRPRHPCIHHPKPSRHPPNLSHPHLRANPARLRITRHPRPRRASGRESRDPKRAS